jgi:CHASE3 domain sensor protein
MRSFIAACVAAIVIAVVSYYVLDMYQQTASTAYRTEGARI